VSGSLLSEAASFRVILAGFDPHVLSGRDCARVAEDLAVTEKACAAARLLASARAVAAGAHRDRGFRDGAAWLSQQSGTTGTAARQALETANRLEDCSATREALLSGEISLAQAGEIVRTESETPGAEAALLDVARHSDLSQLREQARDHRLSHIDVEDLHARQHQARYFRHWRDQLGMVCFTGSLPPETGLPFIRRVQLAACRARRLARGAGQDQQRFEAHAADALTDLVAGETVSRRPDRAELVIVCDLFAWRRGRANPGEVCHIIDGGPIPVDVAKELSADAFLAAVLHDGVNIQMVKRFGRYQPAELRRALDLGPVPGFTGRACADCGQRWGLEYDHIDPVAHRGPTSYDNIQARCYHCHQVKTERDRQAGLLGAGAPRPPNTS
jgi:HNH endonuclease